MYLVDDTPTTTSEGFPSLDANYWKEQFKAKWIPFWLMELGKSLNVLIGVNL
jgi:hypothetical protein